MPALSHPRPLPILILVLAAVAAVPAPAQDGLPHWGQLDGFVHLRAYQLAFPERVEDVAFRNDDWAIRVDDIWFYWANGRILPAKARHAWEDYAPMRLYRYDLGPYRVPSVAPGSEGMLAAWIDRDPESIPRRHNGFLGVLYGALSAGQAAAIMETVSFLGHRVKVHPLLVDPLARVQEEIDKVAAANPTVAAFIDTLIQVDGQHWREIAGTRTLSYHSYGIAIDLIPGHYNGDFSYWRWAAESGVDRWWTLPLEHRWLLPEDMVEVFEAHGFIWGGKWLFFDAIHLEYRPEIHAVNRILAHDETYDTLPRSAPAEPSAPVEGSVTPRRR